MDNKIIKEDAAQIISLVDLQELAGKKILITGASGLLGTYFIYSLAENANRGNVPQSLSIMYRNNLPKYLEFTQKISWIKNLQGDSCDEQILSQLDFYDYIIHLAGYGQPGKFLEEPINALRMNTTLTIRLLEHLTPSGKFVFASTSSVYMGLNKDAFSENDIGITNPMHPRACYIEGKRCGEAIVNAFRAQGVDAKSVRISMTYGPGVRQSDRRVLYELIKKSMDGKIDLLDDGCAKRIYCYITNSVELILKILLHGMQPVYNVGGIEETSILDMAKYIGEYMNAKVILPNTPHTLVGSPQRDRLDMSMTLKEFPITYVSFRDGLIRTINWYQKNYGGA